MLLCLKKYSCHFKNFFLDPNENYVSKWYKDLIFFSKSSNFSKTCWIKSVFYLFNFMLIYILAFTLRLASLFHWSVCRFLYTYYALLITFILYYIFIFGNTSKLSVLLFFICHVLIFQKWTYLKILRIYSEKVNISSSKITSYFWALWNIPLIFAPYTKEWKGDIIKYLLLFSQVLANHIEV